MYRTMGQAVAPDNARFETRLPIRRESRAYKLRAKGSSAHARRSQARTAGRLHQLSQAHPQQLQMAAADGGANRQQAEGSLVAIIADEVRPCVRASAGQCLT